MFEICVESDFSAAHRLNNYRGACENLHGHNFKVEVVVRCKKLNQIYIGIDFKELKKYLKEILSTLDHRYLNEIDYFSKTNPTSEMIAKYIFETLKPRIKDCMLYSVSVYETSTSKVTYTED
ncbi:MAG: 6-carboxytetrahydropterin synthase QueD [Desulfurella sp.]|uniref:6-carboxytetrahydropterin synthase QueD n=1 Tax=Desulfurella sp. TaxID=1962857 RepID=UPI003C7823B4